MRQKNYVEKYYNINEKLFTSVKSRDLINAISNIDSEKLKSLMVSFLTTDSAVISIIARQVAMANDDMKYYHEEIKNGFITMSFSSISKEMAAKYSDLHRQFMEDIEENDNNQDYDHFLYVIAFPSTPYSMFLNERDRS